jgi:hypothetical protein
VASAFEADQLSLQPFIDGEQKALLLRGVNAAVGWQSELPRLHVGFLCHPQASGLPPVHQLPGEVDEGYDG